MRIVSIAEKTLGPKGTRVTELGLGAGPLGDPLEATPDSQAQLTLATAWDAGVRYFDTAPWYGNTLSEHRLGQFLRTRAREELVVSTKVGRVYSRPADPSRYHTTEHGTRWQGGLPFVPRFDFSGSGIRRSYEDSLQRLGLNRVDFLVIHDLDQRHQRGEAGVSRAIEQLDAGGGFQELDAMRLRGEIRAIGAGVNHTGMIPRLLERFAIDYFLIAMPYTLLEQDALDGELQMCAERGVQVVIGSVFASGILATGTRAGAQYGYQPAAAGILRKVAQLESVCAAHSVSLTAAAMAFPLAHPAVAAIIPGAESAQQVEQNVAAYHSEIPREFWQQIRRQGLVRADAPLPID